MFYKILQNLRKFYGICENSTEFVKIVQNLSKFYRIYNL